MIVADHRLLISDLTVSYNRIPALHHISLRRASAAACVALLGPNGAGKSTLLKALAGLLPIETGDDHLSRRLRSAARRRILPICRSARISTGIFPRPCAALVEMGRYPANRLVAAVLGGRSRGGDRAIAAMQLEELEQRQISALSGGQQQRAFLARALAQEAHVFLLG